MRLVLWPSALWQHGDAHRNPVRQRLAEAVPPLLAADLAALPDSVRVLHVGPVPHDRAATILGGRYRHVAQVAPAAFARRRGAADLLVTCNAAATTLGSALAVELPIVLGQCRLSGDSLEAVLAGLPPPGTDAAPPPVRDFIRATLPLRPFRAAPLRLARFLQPVVRGNPCYDALVTAELLDAAAFTAACRQLLFSDESAAALRDRQRQLVRRIRALPSPRQRFLSSPGLRLPPGTT